MDIPLLSVDALQSLAHFALDTVDPNELETVHCIRPMIDARRMEVYSAAFDLRGNPVTGVAAVVVDGDSFRDELDRGPVLFIGDGAAKCQSVITHPNAIFRADILPSAQGMFALAERKLATGEIEDVAYFEPYYLKDFVAGKAKKPDG
jgi:tRNA threonylcarbamoyladenosine biosynthesis protein TsaB